MTIGGRFAAGGRRPWFEELYPADAPLHLPLSFAGMGLKFPSSLFTRNFHPNEETFQKVLKS